MKEQSVDLSSFNCRVSQVGKHSMIKAKTTPWNLQLS